MSGGGIAPQCVCLPAASAAPLFPPAPPSPSDAPHLEAVCPSLRRCFVGCARLVVSLSFPSFFLPPLLIAGHGRGNAN